MRKEDEEVSEDKKLVEGIKIISGAWMGIWWAKTWMPLVDLEKLREVGMETGSDSGSETGSEAGSVT